MSYAFSFPEQTLRMSRNTNAERNPTNPTSKSDDGDGILMPQHRSCPGMAQQAVSVIAGLSIPSPQRSVLKIPNMLKGLKYTLHCFCVSESQTVWLNEFPLHSVSNTYPSKPKVQSVHARKKLCYRVAVSVRLINTSASKVLLLWWFLLVQKYKYFNKETKRISILIDTAWTVKGMEIKIADVFILKWIQNSLIATK